jgi:hypothetical protein
MPANFSAMGWPWLHWRKTLGTIALLLGTTALWLWIGARYASVYVEHGPMESFQAGCLALGCLLFALRLSPSPRPRVSSTHERILFAALALFYGTFMLLEFDTREFDWPLFNRIFHGVIRNVWLGALWFIIGFLIFRHFRGFFSALWRWLWTGPGRLFMAAGVFWVAGAFVDKLKPFDLRSQNLFMEELLENNAALLMILSAITCWSRHADPAPQTAAAGWVESTPPV